MNRRRRGGILAHPTSLPGRFPVGDLGHSIERFLDWLSAAGLHVWQVLPLGPTGLGNSPYGALSAFAGNPLLIAPDLLVEEGLLAQSSVASVPAFGAAGVDFEAANSWKDRLLRESWSTFQHDASAEIRSGFDAFKSQSDNSHWLDDWTLYMALREHHGAADWRSWSHDLVLRDPSALDHARKEHAGEIEYQTYLQFLFFRQWSRVREEARRRGIEIMGDLPIYVAFDSADVWAHPDLFLLDDERAPISVAGVPPDYFSETGQRWGNPLYRWDRMADTGYEWWIERLRANFLLADFVRLDHFRAFSAYWAIPSSEPTAVHGEWLAGPGIHFFDALRRVFGDLPLVAEDLGSITTDVDELRVKSRIPGMKVLQFAFGSHDSTHLPHHYTSDVVVYTGTHDNDTTRGWFEHASDEEKQRALDYCGGSSQSIEWDLIRIAYTSVAELAIAPLQDVFSLGSDARMNTPGDPKNNWAWRAREEDLRQDRAARLRRLAEVCARL